MFGSLINKLNDSEWRPYRNIKGIRETQDLFDDLADDLQDASIAISVEGVGKPVARSPLIERPFEYGLIQYPFLQEHWQDTLFSDGTRYGVWYGSMEVDTTVYETVHHWRRFVTDTYPALDREIVADRRVFRVFCRGVLVDLRGKERRWPALTANDYGFTQQLGYYLHEQNINGVLVKSARCVGVNLASFTPDILSNPEDVCCLNYTFNPAACGRILVERTPGITWLQI